MSNQDLVKKNIVYEFTQAKIELSPLELERFVELHELLEKYRVEYDLTRISSLDNIISKHYLDGALAARYLNPRGLMMDLGSGAGFPGLPLAICRPNWNLVLAEPRGKRLTFMEMVVNALNLKNVEFYPHKVGPNFDLPIESIVTRDFGNVSEILDLVINILPPAGQLYLLKGKAVTQELTEAQNSLNWPLYELVRTDSYLLGSTGLERKIVYFKKKNGCEKNKNFNEKLGPKIIEISSRENLRYKEWLKLCDGRQIRKSKTALCSGTKIIKDILLKTPTQALGILVRRLSDLEELKIDSSIPIYLIRAEIFPALDIFGTGGPLLLINAPTPPPWDPFLAFSGIRLFVPLQDPANLGTLLRTAAALGAEVVLLKQAASPWHPKSLRAAGPAVFQTRLFSGPSLEELSKMNLPELYALSPKGQNLNLLIPKSSLGLVLGLEGPGLDDLWPEDRRLSIPMKENVESLNAAAAGAIALAILGEKQKPQS